MHELAIPTLVPVPDSATLIDAVADHARHAPDKALFAIRRGGAWSELSAADFAEQVAACAKGLIAAGVAPGDRVVLLSRTRFEWTLLDYAIWTAGAVCVPIYETASAEQISAILTDSGARAVVVETAGHEQTVRGLDAGGISGIEEPRIWQIDAGAIAALRTAGEAVTDTDLALRRAGITADTLATIVYTSGTTGQPKGCRLTHRNLLVEVRNATPGLASLFSAEGSTLLFLPLAHIFARIVQIGALEVQARLGHTADVTNLVRDLGGFAPTFLLSVPRVFEKIYNAAKQQAHADGKGRIFDLAEDVAIDYSRALDAGRPGFGLRLRHRLFDRLVYRRIRSSLGGQLVAAVSGGAPLGARLGHFFRGIGITVYEGYGLTETSAASTFNVEDALRIGTVGRPFPGVAVRIAEHGEIWIRGEHVFAGYWNNPAATADVLDEDGWFHTGDLGSLDEQGYLQITGRSKEMIVTAGGKNVAPAALEDRVRAHPLVSQCLVVGDQRPFIGALITLDPDAVATWTSAGPAGSRTGHHDDPELRAQLQAAVDEANATVSRAESIREFRVLETDFTEVNGLLTPSLKVKRAAAMKVHADAVESIYAR